MLRLGMRGRLSFRDAGGAAGGEAAGEPEAGERAGERRREDHDGDEEQGISWRPWGERSLESQRALVATGRS